MTQVAARQRTRAAQRYYHVAGGGADMLHGKVVMITGAASGIAASMARVLHQRGAHLVFT